VLSLNSLAGWEDAVLASIEGAHGTAEERDRQIERSGLFGEYPAIVRAYEELFADPPSAAEAIKRAVFLVWRAAMELPARTGIATLPESTVRATLDALDAQVRHGSDDEELRWMLAWYHAQAPMLLELYGATPQLLRAATTVHPDAWRNADISAQSMAVRGQLGRYWVSMATSSR